MAKIFIRYKIENAQPKYVPGMNISGKVWVESQEAKEKKLKNLEIRFIEYYEVYESRKSGKSRITQWYQMGKKLSKFPVVQKVPLPAGATLEYDFGLELPNWEPKHEKYHRNWWLALFFVQKTGLMATGGARPLDATFIIPCDGSTAPMSIIQGVIGGASASTVEGAGSIPGAPGGTPSMDQGYAESLAQQAVSGMQTGGGIGQSTIQRLESMFPPNDELYLKTMVKVGVEIHAQLSNHWNSPVIVSRTGMAFISPDENHWKFQYLPWVTIRKLIKAVKFGSALDQVSGDIMMKIGKRSAFGRIFLKIMRDGNESRSQMKQRKKEFRQMLPDLYRSAKRAQLGGVPVIMVFRGAGGLGDPVHVSGPAPGYERVPSQSSDGDLFPGFSQEITASSSQSFDFGAPPPGQATESFDEDWDDDWFEEEQPAPAPAQPAPPQTNFLPEKQSKSDDSKEEDFEWDEWED